MTILKCDFCGKPIHLDSTMPPSPGITITGQQGYLRYDCCIECSTKILINSGKPEDAKYLLEKECNSNKIINLKSIRR